MISVFKRGKFYSFSGYGDGSVSAPWYWYALDSGGTLCHVNNEHTGEADNGRLYFRVKLKAGTEYIIAQTSPGNGDGKIWLYDQDMKQFDNADDSEAEFSGVCFSDALYFTPETAGVYIIGAGAYSDSRGDYTVGVYPAPESEKIPPGRTGFYTSCGFSTNGRPLKFRSAMEAGCAENSEQVGE